MYTVGWCFKYENIGIVELITFADPWLFEQLYFSNFFNWGGVTFLRICHTTLSSELSMQEWDGRSFSLWLLSLTEAIMGTVVTEKQTDGQRMAGQTDIIKERHTQKEMLL